MRKPELEGFKPPFKAKIVHVPIACEILDSNNKLFAVGQDPKKCMVILYALCMAYPAKKKRGKK